VNRKWKESVLPLFTIHDSRFTAFTDSRLLPIRY
jgi:hypothetical protein